MYLFIQKNFEDDEQRCSYCDRLNGFVCVNGQYMTSPSEFEIQLTSYDGSTEIAVQDIYIFLRNYEAEGFNDSIRIELD